MGWTDDLSTVSGALKQNFRRLGPLPVSSMTVGLAYLWEEREAELTDLSRSAELLMKDYPTPPEDELIMLKWYADLAGFAYVEKQDALKGLLATAGLELVDWVGTVALHKPSHFVAKEADGKRVVVAVRGTASIADALTDGDAAPEPYGKKRVAHRGMAVAARGLVSKISHLIKGAAAPGAEVAIVGHSLGAGTASLLGILLQEELPKHNIKSFAFATPAVLNLDGAKACASGVTSVVLQDDVVPRASLGNIQALQAELAALEWGAMAKKDFPVTTRVGKAASVAGDGIEAASKSLGEFATKTAVKTGMRDKALGFTGKDSYQFGDITKTAASKGASMVGGLLGKGKGKDGSPAEAVPAPAPAPAPVVDEQEFPHLFVPGRVIYVRRLPRGAARASVVPNDLPSLCRIELSNTMVADHSIDLYSTFLDTAVKGPPEIVLEGTLKKRKGGLKGAAGPLTPWSTRFFRLMATLKTLQYFEGEGEGKGLPRGEVKLAGCAAEPVKMTGRSDFCFKVEHKEKASETVYLEADDADTVEKWISVINDVATA